jgi:3-hydroxybutyryl-CoA dehydrogenase
MGIESFGVVGAGQMGSGVAQVAAQAGLRVLLHDADAAAVERGLAAIGQHLQRGVDKGRLGAEERGSILARIRPATRLSELAPCDFVLEAVVERADVKTELFRALDGICRAGVILATNTSSISVTRIAAATERPERVIGMHFMNPVPVMKLVELIRGLGSSDATAREVAELARSLGKTPVECRDFPGFVSNRVLMPMINEAIFCLHEGVAGPAEIDEIMKLGMNHPMGPLELADLIGLDTCLAILEVLHGELGDSKYRPCPLLRKHVEAGWLGRKSGRGFYDHATARR